MATLEERYREGVRMRAFLRGADPSSVPPPIGVLDQMAPDLERIVTEACFGATWTRPGLTLQQRCLATISAITALGKERQLKAHVEGGLAAGLSPEQLIEALMHLILYVGAPAVNSAMVVAKEVFDEKGIRPQPYRVYDPSEDSEELARRGMAKRREFLDDPAYDEPGDFGDVHRDLQRLSWEYLWASIWTRPGLDMQSRCICTLSALTVLGRERMIRSYVRGALRLGLSQEQVLELFFHLAFYAGLPATHTAIGLAKEVFGHEDR